MCDLWSNAIAFYQSDSVFSIRTLGALEFGNFVASWGSVAAYLAGLAVGYWASLEKIRRNWVVDRSFLPEISQEERAVRVKGWKKALRCTAGWEKD